MSQIDPKTAQLVELQKRFTNACGLNMPVDLLRIEDAILRWAKGFTEERLNIRFINSVEEMESASGAAWASGAARAVRDAAWASGAHRAVGRAVVGATALAASEFAEAARAAWFAWTVGFAWDGRFAIRTVGASEAARAGAHRDAVRAAWEFSWIATTAIGALSLDSDAIFRTWLPILEAFEAGAFMMWAVDSEIYVATRPARVRTDSRMRLHCQDGPAFEWLSDIKDFYWQGVHVPELVVMSPESITASMVDNERNAEVRRVMVERYPGGVAQYLRDSGAVEIHRDGFGILYRKEQDEDEPIVMVKVVNATPEPDGSYKDYWLRVPPTITRAREAVAWTFDMSEDAYSPEMQT